MDKVKEIIKKFGGYIGLGGFALAAISVFMPFVRATVLGFSVSAAFTEDGAWGWIVLLLALAGAAIFAIETFKKDLFGKTKNNAVELLVNYLPLGLAGIIFLITLIEGLQAKTSYTHLSIGFFFIIIGVLAAGCVVVFKRFIMKDMFTMDGTAPAKPVAPTAPAKPVEEKKEN